MGNHDLRLESRLANLVPEYAKVHGFQIKDHFPYWNTCMSLWVNNDLIIKHRFKGGPMPHTTTRYGLGKVFALDTCIP